MEGAVNFFHNDDRDDRWYETTPVAPPAAARDSAEGCAGDDAPDDELSHFLDWSGLLCAATFVAAVASAVFLHMTGRWSGCMRWLESLLSGGTV